MLKTLIGFISVLFIVVLIGISSPYIIRQVQKSMRPQGMPELHPCTICLNGLETLEGVVVTLYPEDETSNDWGTLSGQTKSDNKVVIKTDYKGKKYSGVFPGKYRVTVTKTITSDIDEYNPLNSYIEKRYAFKSTTPLEITVPSENPYELSITLSRFETPSKADETTQAELEKMVNEEFRSCRMIFLHEENPVPGLLVKLQSTKNLTGNTRGNIYRKEFIGYTNDEGVTKISATASGPGAWQYLLKEEIPEGDYDVSICFPKYNENRNSSEAVFHRMTFIQVTEEGYDETIEINDSRMQILRTNAGME